MFAVPAPTPVSEVLLPAPGLTTAIEVELLIHTPPGVAQLRGIEDPMHTLDRPTIADGIAMTLIVVVAAHPVPNVYDINDVPATLPAVTIPVPPILAIAGLEEFHAPPPVASV